MAWPNREPAVAESLPLPFRAGEAWFWLVLVGHNAWPSLAWFCRFRLGGALALAGSDGSAMLKVLCYSVILL